MRVEVVQAWPRRHESRAVDLADGATVGDALAAAAIASGTVAAVSVFGERCGPERKLQEGDRVELLRPLHLDPKEARRRRAARRGAT